MWVYTNERISHLAWVLEIVGTHLEVLCGARPSLVRGEVWDGRATGAGSRALSYQINIVVKSEENKRRT